MTEKTRCPLCGGDVVSKKCSSCGYVIPDESELDYYTDLMNTEPEDYPTDNMPHSAADAAEKPKDMIGDVYNGVNERFPKINSPAPPARKVSYGNSPQNNAAYARNPNNAASNRTAGGYIPYGQNINNINNGANTPQAGNYIPYGQNQNNAPNTPQTGNYPVYGQNANNLPSGSGAGNMGITFSFPNSVRNKMAIINAGRYKVPALIAGSIFLPSIVLIILGAILDSKGGDTELKRMGKLLKIIGVIKLITIHY